MAPGAVASELTQQRILRDGGRELEFRNEMLRGYAYLNVPSPLRKALHGLIADRLMGAEASGEAIPGLMLAWHCYRSGHGSGSCARVRIQLVADHCIRRASHWTGSPISPLRLAH